MRILMAEVVFSLASTWIPLKHFAMLYAIVIYTVNVKSQVQEVARCTSTRLFCAKFPRMICNAVPYAWFGLRWWGYELGLYAAALVLAAYVLMALVNVLVSICSTRAAPPPQKAERKE